MAAFQFETILPPERKQNSLLELKADLLDKERNAAYAKGFKDGVNVTKDAVEVETNRLLARISEFVDDLTLTNEQACSAVMKSLTPLIEAIISQLSPEVLRAKLIEETGAALTEILREHRGVELEIEVPQTLENAVKALCANHGIAAQVCVRDDLHDLEVRLNWDDGYDHLDMEALRESIRGRLQNTINCLDEDNDERRDEFG